MSVGHPQGKRQAGHRLHEGVNLVAESCGKIHLASKI
jgi:hypothetical protein